MYKKMWKMRKDKSAVSPVIATILMVAITVVLAAVLYVMVMGFGGSTASTAPAVTLQKNGNVVTIAINPQTADTKMGVTINGVGPYTLDIAAKAALIAAGVTAVETNNAKISTGDTLTVAANVTSIQLVYIPSGVAGTDKQNVGNLITF
jgi:archaeal type IV pilus assembly protein PilA